MQIVCPQCATAYAVEAEALGAAGRSVRCARCQAVWHAGADDASDAALAATDWHPPAAVMPLPGATFEEARAAAALDWVPAAEVKDEEAAVGAAGAAAPADGGAATAIAVVETAAPTPAAAAIEGTVLAAEQIEARPAEIHRRPRRAARRSPRAWPRLTAPRAAAALFGVIVALVYARDNMVRLLPQTASLYALIGLPVNLRGVVFAEVKTARETRNDIPVLIVEGTLKNVTAVPVAVPQLRIALRNGAAGEVYAWTTMPEQTVLPPGESQPFRTRLASPPAEGREVLVRFVNRRDRIAAAR